MQQMIWIIHTSESMAQTLQENKHKLKKTKTSRKSLCVIDKAVAIAVPTYAASSLFQS